MSVVTAVLRPKISWSAGLTTPTGEANWFYPWYARQQRPKGRVELELRAKEGRRVRRETSRSRRMFGPLRKLFSCPHRDDSPDRVPHASRIGGRAPAAGQETEAEVRRGGRKKRERRRRNSCEGDRKNRGYGDEIVVVRGRVALAGDHRNCSFSSTLRLSVGKPGRLCVLTGFKQTRKKNGYRIHTTRAVGWSCEGKSPGAGFFPSVLRPWR